MMMIHGVKRGVLVGMMCLVWMTVQAQVKVCMNYADFKADKWKPYTELIEGKEPDSCRVKYDGIDFTFKTDDKEVNKVIKHDVFLMSVDNQLFVNQHMLRDDPVTYEQYYGRNKKGDRQSAANILPILVKKGLIQDYHHKK